MLIYTTPSFVTPTGVEAVFNKIPLCDGLPLLVCEGLPLPVCDGLSLPVALGDGVKDIYIQNRKNMVK